VRVKRVFWVSLHRTTLLNTSLLLDFSWNNEWIHRVCMQLYYLIPFSHVLYINASAEVRHNPLLVGIQLSKSWSSQQISDIPS
jgi:hypothetical protein